MNIKETVAPIPIELLKEYFADDSIVFKIDYSASTLKGNKLLTYLSNLDVPTILSGFKQVPVEEKFDLIKEYMNHNLVIASTELEVIVLIVLFEAAGLNFLSEAPPTYRYIFDEMYLDKEEVKRFVDENNQLTDRWLTMMASLSVYNIYTITDFKESVPNDFATIDDYDYCGVNFASLIKHEQAVELVCLDREVFYFEKQFNEHMFKGKNLWFYWNHYNNFLATFTMGVSEGIITHDGFVKELEKGYDDVSII